MNDLRFDFTQLAQWQQEGGDNSRRMQRLRRRLPEAVMELTPRQRQMLHMQFQLGMTCTQIARELGVNKSTVSRCLRRARQNIYSRLRFSL